MKTTPWLIPVLAVVVGMSLGGCASQAQRRSAPPAPTAGSAVQFYDLVVIAPRGQSPTDEEFRALAAELAPVLARQGLVAAPSGVKPDVTVTVRLDDEGRIAGWTTGDDTDLELRYPDTYAYMPPIWWPYYGYAPGWEYGYDYWGWRSRFGHWGPGPGRRPHRPHRPGGGDGGGGSKPPVEPPDTTPPVVGPPVVGPTGPGRPGPHPTGRGEGRGYAQGRVPAPEPAQVAAPLARANERNNSSIDASRAPMASGRGAPSATANVPRVSPGSRGGRGVMPERAAVSEPMPRTPPPRPVPREESRATPPPAPPPTPASSSADTGRTEGRGGRQEHSGGRGRQP